MVDRPSAHAARRGGGRGRQRRGPDDRRGDVGLALIVGDPSFAYVVEYANRDLPWQYALSAIWAGQAGSLLIWAWFLGLLAAVHRLRPRREPSSLCEPAFALLMAYLAFLTSLMVFGADPMAPSLSSARLGEGLSPLLQHPAMLIHPPIVFLGYAGWAVPFALAMAAMLGGRGDTRWVARGPLLGAVCVARAGRRHPPRRPLGL